MNCMFSINSPRIKAETSSLSDFSLPLVVPIFLLQKKSLHKTDLYLKNTSYSDIEDNLMRKDVVQSFNILEHTTSTSVNIIDFSCIPTDSPVYKFQFFKRGWDGYWAYPFSQQVLIRAHKFWNDLTKIIKNKPNFPVVTAGGNGSIAFAWTNCIPHKELEIWIFDQPDYYSEWLLVADDCEKEGKSFSNVDLLNLFEKYQEV